MYLVKNDKSPFYQLVYFIDGKRTTVSTKTKNKKDADKFIANFSLESQEPKHQIKLISLSKFCDEYVEYNSSIKSKSYVRSIQLSFKMLIIFSGDINLNRLGLYTLDKFITSTYSRTQRGAALYYRTLKAAFSKAVIWSYLSENPLKRIKAPKVSKSFPVFITQNELQIILSNTKEQLLKNIIVCAFYTGMRLGEILNMKWSWIDFNQNIITVKCSDDFTTKSKKERIIPISKVLKPVLKNSFPKIVNINKEDFVFYRIPGIKLNEDFISKKFKKVVKTAQLNNKVHFHTLRHSFASNLVQKGVSLYVVKELLGHEDLSTTQIYSHLQKQNLMDAVILL